MERKITIFVAAIIISIFLCMAHRSYGSSEEAQYKLNEEALKMMKAGNFEGAINALKAALSYNPSNKVISKNLAVAYNNYGFSLMKKGLVNQGIEKLENSLYYDPDNPYTLYNIAQAYYGVQNMTKAKEYLDRAYKINKDIKGLSGLLDKINKESKVEVGFEKTDTAHFIIAASGDINVSSLSYIRTYLEEAYGRIGMFLDYYPANKTIAVLYSEANYEAALKGKPHWTLAIYDGKVRIPVNKFKYTNDEVIKIIYHEYAHALVFSVTKGNCPLWLNEGIASKAEDYVKPMDRDLIKKYMDRFGVIDVRKIPNDLSKIKNVELATSIYIESYLLVDYIVERFGNSSLIQILKYLGKGLNIGSAIKTVLKKDADQFQNDWEAYVKEKYGISDIRKDKTNN